jgi:CrcB protein
MWIGVAGFLGAVARYGVDVAFGPRARGAFPWAIFLVNVSGCFLLGLVFTVFTERFVASSTVRLVLTVGFLGAYTTFSTFALDTVRLLQDGAAVTAGLNAFGSVLLGVIAAYGGIMAGRALS